MCAPDDLCLNLLRIPTELFSLSMMPRDCSDSDITLSTLLAPLNSTHNSTMSDLNVAWGDMDSDDGDSFDGLEAVDMLDSNDEEDAVGTDIGLLAFTSVRDMQTAHELLSEPTSQTRVIDPEHNILCRYISEHSHGVILTNGYVGRHRYVTPLHVPAMVVGHSHRRVAVNQSSTTKVGVEVVITSRLSTPHRYNSPKGTKVLSSILLLIDSHMTHNDINPPEFDVCISVMKDCSDINAPITLAYSEFVNRLKDTPMQLYHDRKIYTIPTDCPSTRYRTPIGLASTMNVNSVILTYPQVNQYLVSAELREPVMEEKGFLCMCSGASSAALKGLIRYCVSGTVCRCYKMGVGSSMRGLSKILEDMDCMCVRVGCSFVYVAGVRIALCERCVSVVTKFVNTQSLRGPHCLTIHECIEGTVKGVALSFCTGALMRCASDGRWIDSKSRQGGYMGYESILSPTLSLVPYISHINPIRASLLNIYMTQALCTPCCTYHPSIVLTPLYREHMIATDSTALVSEPNRSDMIPGLNLYCIFMNMEHTHEDGIVMSRSAARRFKYKALVSVYLAPSTDTIPKVSTVIKSYSTPWWQNHFDGTVESISASVDGIVRVAISCECYPVNGDKFTTLHGQKGVATILDDYCMPAVNGRHADIVIGTSSIIKRQTVSQLLEAAYNMYCVEVMDTNHCVSYDMILKHYIDNFRVTNHNITNMLSKYESIVEVSGEEVKRITSTVHDSIRVSSSVRVNHGIIRVMQSSFLSSFRRSSTSRLAGISRLRPETSSSRGGSRSLGEMEILQLAASGMVSVLNEFNIASDSTVVSICRRCRCLTMICECDNGNMCIDSIRLPYRTIKGIITLYCVHRVKVLIW